MVEVTDRFQVIDEAGQLREVYARRRRGSLDWGGDFNSEFYFDDADRPLKMLDGATFRSFRDGETLMRLPDPPP